MWLFAEQPEVHAGDLCEQDSHYSGQVDPGAPRSPRLRLETQLNPSHGPEARGGVFVPSSRSAPGGGRCYARQLIRLKPFERPYAPQRRGGWTYPNSPRNLPYPVEPRDD